MEKDDNFWLNVSYLVFAAVSGYIFWQAIYTVGLQTGWLERYDSWWTPMNHGVAVLLGIGTTFYLKADADRNEYFLSSIAELRKVTWPSFDDTRRMTIIVCVVVGVFAVVLSVFDTIWSFALKEIITFARS